MARPLKAVKFQGCCTGEEVMIAGFISQGGASNRLLIRELGPSLTAFGVTERWRIPP